MPKIINASVKSQIIKMHLEAKGRNEIARDLKKQGVDVSSGTVSGVLKQYRESFKESDIRVTTFSEPLADKEFKDSKDISIKDHAINNTKDFKENGYPVAPAKGAPLNWFTNDYETESAVNNNGVINAPEEERVEKSIDEKLEDGNNSKYTSPTTTNPKVETNNKKESNSPRKYPREPKFIEDRFDVERRAWDFYGLAQTRILEQINQEKYQRKHELRVIERRKQKLEDWKVKLDEKTKQLDSREGRILEAEPFLAVAKQLADLRIGMEEIIPLIETVRERAEAERTDHKTSAARIAQDYRQSGGIQKQIERANQELALINMATIKKQQAITVVEDLINNKGITESQIVQLINFASEWNKYWQGNGNLQQPNNPGGGNGNLQQQGINNPGSNNGYGGPSMNDLIRLNLLKSSTTNMMNRMGALRY